MAGDMHADRSLTSNILTPYFLFNLGCCIVPQPKDIEGVCRKSKAFRTHGFTQNNFEVWTTEVDSVFLNF